MRSRMNKLNDPKTSDTINYLVSLHSTQDLVVALCTKLVVSHRVQLEAVVHPPVSEQ